MDDQSTDTTVLQGEVVGGEPKKTRNTVLWIIILVIVLMLCCCCVLIFGVMMYFWNYGDAIFGLESALTLLAV
jgi:hypothetical protein